MLTIPVTFEYGLESEIKRVKGTLDIFDWLNKNNYRFILPNGIIDPKNTENDVLNKLVQDEYDVKKYQIAETAIIKSWEGNNGFINKINQKITGSYLLKDLNIILTTYGTQGSYRTPNSIIINISNIPPEFLIKTVVHESFHLMIEHLIQKNSVEHWVKERIVDLITDLEYKSRFKMQAVPDWSLAIDSIFKENYPNMTLITEIASKVHKK